jgi:membrane protease YdiL (CAAX protease family)
MSVLSSTWTATWKIVVFVTAWGVLFAPAVLLIAPETDEPDAPIKLALRVFFEILGAVTVTLAAWGMVRFVDRRPFASLGLEPTKVFRDLLVGLGLGSAMIGIAVAISWLAGWTHTQPAGAFSLQILGALGVAVLFNSASQEILVRGYILQTVETQSNGPTAVIVSSLLFVGLHAGALAEGGLLPGINLFIAGALLGLAYTATRNLWLPTALHFAWNFLQGPVLGIAVSGQALDGGWQLLTLEGPAILTGGSFGLEGGLIATLVTAMALFCVVLLGRRWNGRASPIGIADPPW